MSVLELNEIVWRRFYRFLAAAGIRIAGEQREATQQAWDFIDKQYGQSHRFYHTLTHVYHILDEIEQMAYGANLSDEDIFILAMAGFFHDIVYDPHASDNELQSAGYAYECLNSLGFPSAICGAVSDLICVTAHVNPPKSVLEKILVDADFGIFSEDRSDYLTYAKNVRLEYSHLEDDVWVAGRSTFLQKLIERDRLYYVTDNFYLEKIVIENIKAELTLLKSLENGWITWKEWPYESSVAFTPY